MPDSARCPTDVDPRSADDDRAPTKVRIIKLCCYELFDISDANYVSDVWYLFPCSTFCAIASLFEKSIKTTFGFKDGLLLVYRPWPGGNRSETASFLNFQ